MIMNVELDWRKRCINFNLPVQTEVKWPLIGYVSGFSTTYDSGTNWKRKCQIQYVFCCLQSMQVCVTFEEKIEFACFVNIAIDLSTHSYTCPGVVLRWCCQGKGNCTVWLRWLFPICRSQEPTQASASCLSPLLQVIKMLGKTFIKLLNAVPKRTLFIGKGYLC